MVATPDASTGSDPNSPAFSYAIAIPLPPLTQCTIYPEGDSGDAAHTNIVSAGAAGEVRFYPPSEDWGTRLSLSCTLNGGAQGTYLVDLNDRSTFKRESQADLQPRGTGTRPALTGDLSALSLINLLQQGYPPRPDPVKNPKLYADWAKAVTTSADVFNAVLVANLGPGFGTYNGEYDVVWTGFVQSADGFSFSPPGALVTNYTGTLYGEYVVNMPIPLNGGCAAGGGCTTGIWGGIGGTQVYLGYGFGISQSTALLQSGFAMINNNVTQPFIEFIGPVGNGPPYILAPPSGDVYAAADDVIVWGWPASDVNCDWTSSSAAYGCFGFWDTTHGWVVSGYSTILPAPSPGLWLPTSAEFVAEATRPIGGSPTAPVANASYGYNYMYGDAWDTTWTEHLDPGASGGTDPYVYSRQNDPSGNPYSIGQWLNGSVDTPEDPMFVIWQNTQ